MSTDIDGPPVYEPITKEDKDHLSEVWADYMATMIQTIQTYLGSTGIFLPQLTTAQREAIQSPQNGQVIYNTTIPSAQYFSAGTWISF
jgi:hypothetical protein